MGDLEGEQLRQRERQVQRPWGPGAGAEAQVPEDPRQPVWLEFMVKGESGRQERAGAGNGALCICICQGMFPGLEERPWVVGFPHVLGAPGG